MLVNVLRNRLFLGGLLFFVVAVVGSLLYSWNVRRTTAAEVSETVRAVESLKPVRPSATIEVDDVSPDTEMLEVSGMLEAAPVEAFAVETSPIGELQATHFTMDPEEMLPIEIAATESDFPEVPVDFPEDMTPVWIEYPHYQMGDMYKHEMIYRVLIELWNRGDRGFINGIFDDTEGRVYPIYPDVVYVTWAFSDYDGHRYASYTLAGPDVDDRQIDDIGKGDFPPHLRVYEFSEAGYDPHEFLDLPRDEFLN